MRFPSVFVVLALAGCHRQGVRDVAPRGRAEAPSASDEATLTSSERTIATPSAGAKPVVLARASSRALATTSTQLLFGDEHDDALRAIAKTGGDSTKVARRAPMPNALAVDGAAVAWVATPGDVVLMQRLDAPAGTQPSTLRDRGIFVDVAASGGDFFVLEAADGGGVLLRITGATSRKLASFEGPPRALLVDDTTAFVVTATKVVKTPRERGEPTTLATGAAFGAAAMDEGGVYVTAKQGDTRILERIAKRDGTTTVVATDVRDAPIAVHRGDVFWFDASRPALRTPKRIVSEDDTLARPQALAVDDDGVFVATPDAIVRVADRK